MAWEKTHTATVRDLRKDQIWQLWQDVNNWHAWDQELEYCRLESPFVAGSQFTLKPKGGPKVHLTLENVEPCRTFTDRVDFPLARMYSIHELQDTPHGLEVIHRIRVEGPLAFLWRKLVAEKVAAGLEEQTQSMIKRAREMKAKVQA